MSWWPRKRKPPYGWDPFDEMMRDFFENFDLLDEHFERMMYQVRKYLEEAMKSGNVKPIVYGFSMTIGPDGVPRIETFGNVPKKVKPGVEEVEEEREPLVEIDEDDKNIYITVELPGVEKKDIDLEVVGEDKLLIKAKGDKRSYRKLLQLPGPIDPDSVKATYHNGILDIRIKKSKVGGKGKKINIE